VSDDAPNGGEVGKAFRRSDPFPANLIESLHATFRDAFVVLPPCLAGSEGKRPTYAECRRVMLECSEKNRVVADKVGKVHQYVGKFESDLRRLERRWAATRSHALDTHKFPAKATNDKMRDAVMQEMNSRLLDEVSEVEADLAEAKELLAHGKVAQAELDRTFEITSRIQASVDGELRINPRS
jgi:hypothetical protein